MIIDDYIKTIEEAMSPAYLEKLWLSFLGNLDTRLEPNATVIIVATRWATNDIIGRILKAELPGWEYIEFPAIAINEDILGRKPGDPLFPERFPLDRLLEIRAARTGTFLWDSLYQQRPIDDIAQLTNSDWIKIVEPLPSQFVNNLRKVRSWDMAATENGGDYTTGALLGRDLSSTHGVSSYILDIRRKQLSPTNVEKLIRTTAEFDGKDVTILLEREPGSQGIALVNHYKNNILPDFNVIEVPTGGKSKVVRAHPSIAAIEFGRLVLQKGPWNDNFIREFDEFPPANSGHDDQIDTVATAYNYLYNDLKSSPVWWDSNNNYTSYGFYGQGNTFGNPNLQFVDRRNQNQNLNSTNSGNSNSNSNNNKITGCVW
jgi:predicted phage terminase large subunit-like protein